MKKLLMTTCAILALAGNAYADEAHCGSPRVFFGEDLRDTNPTVGVDITYNPDTHNWQVFHRLYNGIVASRSQQYAITDWSNDMYGSRWTGSSCPSWAKNGRFPIDASRTRLYGAPR